MGTIECMEPHVFDRENQSASQCVLEPPMSAFPFNRMASLDQKSGSDIPIIFPNKHLAAISINCIDGMMRRDPATIKATL